MNDWLANMSVWFQQAWVWVTSMCAIIVGIGLPSLVQVGKIFASAKLYLTQTKTLLGKLNAVVQTCNSLNALVGTLMKKIEDDKTGELEFLKNLKLVSFNKKEQEVINARIESIENELSSLHEIKGVENVAELTAEEMDNPKKRVKIKVAK